MTRTETFEFWLDHVETALADFAESCESVRTALGDLEDAQRMLKRLLRDAPKGAQECSAFDWLMELANERYEIDLPEHVEMDDDDVRGLRASCAATPTLSAAMSGAELAEYVDARGGCEAAVAYCAQMKDLRTAWTSTDRIDWLMTWMNWHEWPQAMIDEAKRESDRGEEYSLALPIENHETVERIACKRIREALGDDPLYWHETEKCGREFAARQAAAMLPSLPETESHPSE